MSILPKLQAAISSQLLYRRISKLKNKLTVASALFMPDLGSIIHSHQSKKEEKINCGDL